jgi:hypothetical protein
MMHGQPSIKIFTNSDLLNCFEYTNEVRVSGLQKIVLQVKICQMFFISNTHRRVLPKQTCVHREGIMTVELNSTQTELWCWEIGRCCVQIHS